MGVGGFGHQEQAGDGVARVFGVARRRLRTYFGVFCARGSVAPGRRDRRGRRFSCRVEVWRSFLLVGRERRAFALAIDDWILL